MDSKNFGSVKLVVQTVSVVLAVLINCVLIFLIITKSSKKMGNYRHLMIFFCCYSIGFSTMDIIVQPVIHSHKSAFFIIMDLRHRMIPLGVAVFLICAMAGCFGVIIYGIAIHFIYRFFALQREGRTRYFDKKYLPIWLTIPVLAGVCWTLVSYYLFPMSPVTSEYIRPAIEEAFEMDINEVAYSAAIFYPPNETGRKMFNWKSGLGLMLYLLIMTVPFCVIIVVVVKSIDKIKDFPASKYGKDLQVQLYKALVAQTLIPVLSLFLPFGLMFICPILEIECKFVSTAMTFVYAIYPVVDPLPIFFFVESYRNTVTNCLFMRNCKRSRVNVVVEEAPSTED